MKRWLVALGCIVVLSAGCAENDSNENNSIQQAEKTEGSYEGILIVNSIRYTLLDTVQEGTYSIKQEIGEVEQKLPAEVMPEKNFHSNILATGTKIYTIEEDSTLLLTLSEGEEDYQVYKK